MYATVCTMTLFGIAYLLDYGTIFFSFQQAASSHIYSEIDNCFFLTQAFFEYISFQ
jgi:hypothetical protein